MVTPPTPPLPEDLKLMRELHRLAQLMDEQVAIDRWFDSIRMGHGR